MMIDVTQENVSLMLLCTLRYSLGRLTGMPEDCAVLVRQYFGRCTREMQDIIIRDLSEFLDRAERLRDMMTDHHECDLNVWRRLLCDIQALT